MTLLLAWEEIAGIVLVALAAGFVRGASGFGAALVMVPALSLFLPVAPAVATAIFATAATNLPVAMGCWREANYRTLAWMLPAALIGLPAGIWILEAVDPEPLRKGIGAIVLASCGLLLWGRRLAIRQAPGPAAAAGLASGVLNGATALGGPPVVTYFLASGTQPAAARASFIIYFAVLQAVNLAGLALAGVLDLLVLQMTVAAAPAMIAGTVLGTRFFRRGGDRFFRSYAIGLLAVTALAAIYR